MAPSSSPRKQRPARQTDEWLDPSSSTTSTPKKARPTSTLEPTTPSRSSRSQGLINHVHHRAFIRRLDSGEEKTFSVGDQVIVGPGAAPSGRLWLHDPRPARRQRPTFASEADQVSDDDEDEEWSHVDGLEKNEKVGTVTALWEDERGTKWAKVRWFARPGMMWGRWGPPDWAPRHWSPFELCYVHDSEWYASRRLLDQHLSRGKKLDLADMTASEFAECSKCVNTGPHVEDVVGTSDILEPVLVRPFSSSPPDAGEDCDEGQDRTEAGLRVFKCRRMYDSRPQAWDIHGFVKPLPFPLEAIYARARGKGKWDLPVEQRPEGWEEGDEEERERRREKRREAIKKRNREKREQRGREEVIVRQVEYLEDDGRETSSEEEEQDDFEEDPSSDEEEDLPSSDSDDDFTTEPRTTTPRKRRAGAGGSSPSKKKKRARVVSTAAQRAKRQSVQARKSTLLKRRALLPRSLLVPSSSAEDQTARSEADPFARARAALHVSATPEDLPCREDEFTEVEANLEEAIEEGTGSCIYIAGVPGTGKTATVHSVVRDLRQRARNGEVSRFRYFEINGMKITEPNQTYVLLWQFLGGTGERCSPRQAQSNLDAYFNSPSASRETCVVLVDELDQLVQKNTKNEVIYDLFNWPNQPHSRLIVLAVANKMDMPETDLSSKINSRLGSNRIPFRPYTEQDLIEILNSRLAAARREGEGEGEVVSKEAVRLVARKVATVTGDARKALDIARRAVEAVEAANEERRARGETKMAVVTPTDVANVHKAMVANGRVAVLGGMSVHQRAVLLAIAKVVQAKGVPDVPVSDVIHRHATLTTQTLGLPLLAHDDVLSILAGLQAMRLVLCESARLDYFAKVKSELQGQDLRHLMEGDKRFERLVQAQT